MKSYSATPYAVLISDIMTVLVCYLNIYWHMEWKVLVYILVWRNHSAFVSFFLASFCVQFNRARAYCYINLKSNSLSDTSVMFCWQICLTSAHQLMRKQRKIYNTASLITVSDWYRHLIAEHSLCTWVIMLKLNQVISLILMTIVNSLIQLVMLRCMLKLLSISLPVQFAVRSLSKPVIWNVTCAFTRANDLIAVTIVVRSFQIRAA